MDIAAKIYILQRTFREIADTEGERQTDRQTERQRNTTTDTKRRERRHLKKTLIGLQLSLVYR